MKTKTDPKRFGPTLSILAMFLTLLPLAAGLAGAAERSFMDPDDVKYIRELSKANRRGFAFDFSDARQYRYVISRFKTMGKNAGNSPELFRKLKQARRLHIIRKSDPRSARVVNEFEDGSGHAIFEFRRDQDGIHVNAAAMGNVPGGTPYAYIDTCISEGLYPVACDDNEEFGDGFFFGTCLAFGVVGLGYVQLPSNCTP